MKKLIVLLLVCASFIPAKAQPFAFNNLLIGGDVFALVNLDKPFDGGIKAYNVNNNELVILADEVKKLPARPTIIVVWKANWFIGHERTRITASLIKLIVEANKSNYNIVLVNTNMPDDGFNINEYIHPESIKLFQEKEQNWKELPSFVCYDGGFANVYGCEGHALEVLVLDKNRNLIIKVADVNSESVDYFNRYMKFASNKTYIKDKWFYNHEYMRVTSGDGAVFSASREKITPYQFKITWMNQNLQKVIYRYAYKSTSLKPVTRYSNFYAEGDFVFYDKDGVNVISKGDCSNGLVNNITFFDGKNKSFEVKGMQAMNKNLAENFEQVMENLQANDGENPRLFGRTLFKPLQNEEAAVVSEYYETGKLKQISKYSSDGKLVAEYTYYKDGQLSSEQVWNLAKRYYANGKLKEVVNRDENFEPHGLYTTYYENGEVKTRKTYHHGSVQE